MDEFAFVLLAGLILIIILMVAWTSMPAAQLEVTPKTVSLAIEPGSSSSFTITLNGTAQNVTLYPIGEIRNWIFFDKNNFDVSGVEKVNVIITVPSSAVQKIYTGKIRINSTAGEKNVYISINTTKTPVVEASHSIYFGDFSISYSVGSETLASKENFEVSKGYFSDSPVNLVHETLSDEKLNMITEGLISLVIDDTNSAGNLVIEFNGEVIFNKKVGPGSIEIPIEKSKIKKSNTITIRAELPGWKFWMNTVYKIRSVKFVISYQGANFKDFVFVLTENEVKNFKSGILSFRIKNYTLPLGDMTIEINNKLFYKGTPPLYIFSKEFTSLTEVPLNVGSNSITFSTEANSFYDIRDATLTIIYTT